MALASNKEVIVSRSQLVEIGGSFRLHDVFKQSGARLVEVGTTNKTTIEDYEKAITQDTAILLHVHQSNFRIVGFTESVEISELVKLAKKRNILAIDDLGSGAMLSLLEHGLPNEPIVKDSLEAGAHVVCFSGDKLLGGPQSGIIVGRQDLITQIRKHPVYRAIRIDKLTLTALEATLRLYLKPETVVGNIPVLLMLATNQEKLRKMANKIATKLSEIKTIDVEVTNDFSEVGGGALPEANLPTTVIAITHKELSPLKIVQKLRMQQVPIFARVKKDRLLLDMRTVLEDDIPIFTEELLAFFSSPAI
jgi:L-seryl-tRNA(Ser) seleniumtransferase